MGAALVGSALASVPGLAWAAPCPKSRIKCGSQCCAAGVTTCQGRGKNKTCGCQPDQELCGGNCVQSCSPGQTLNPNNCQCQEVCPDVTQLLCCCGYADPITREDIASACKVYDSCPGPGSPSVQQCEAFCQANTPPGLLYNRTSVSDCISPSALGYYAACLPDTSPGQTGNPMCSTTIYCSPSP